jgi:hypothetical protein
MRSNLRFLVAAALLVISCGNRVPHTAGDAGMPSSDAPADTGPMTPLQKVAAIVIPKCAVAGCHDAVSKTHAMDLSTPEKIVSNWVGVRGFDHCTNLDTPRVIPNDPNASLVILKIEGIAVCLQSNRMPLPPRDALSVEEIDVIRAWIAAGAPSDTPPTEDGGQDAVEPIDAPDDSGPEVGGGYRGCSTALPCEPGFQCDGVACGDVWECVTHFDETLEHPLRRQDHVVVWM